MFKHMKNNGTQVSAKPYSNSGDPIILDQVRRHFSGGQRCLDIGCGSGGNAALLTRNAWIVDGITISPNEASLARTVCREVAIHNLEQGLPETIKPESYDVVLASHVLEHVLYPEKLLTDCWRALKPNGGILVVLPNLLFWKNRVKMALGRFEYQNAGIMDYTHCRWYTLDSAKALLAKHGFAIIGCVVDGQILGGTGLPTILEKVLLKVDQVFRRFTPGLIAFQLYFVARKRS